MTKKNQKKPETLVEKTEWQRRHEEFLARKAAKKAAQEKKLAQEEAEKLKESETANKDLNGTSREKGEELTKEEEKVFNKVDKAELKAEKKADRLKNRPNRLALAKVVSIVLVALLTLLVSIFVISPLSKEKEFTVTGLKNADETSILVSTGITKSDYISTVFFKLKDYEPEILKANPWVKSAKMSYNFPNKFTISVTENRVIAYASTETGYQPVLENGFRMPIISEKELPESFLTVNITDEKAVQTLVTKLAKLDKTLVSSIKVINPIKDAATKDLLAIDTSEGHKIRVPLSQLDVKLPFYSKIVGSLTVPSIVDMEVGIYTTTEGLEALMAQEKAEREEAKKLAEEEAKKSEKDDKETTTTRNTTGQNATSQTTSLAETSADSSTSSTSSSQSVSTTSR